MPWVAAAIVGSAIVGGVASSVAADKQADAASSAADTTAAANSEAAVLLATANENAAKYAADAQKYAADQNWKAAKYATDMAEKAAAEAMRLQTSMWETNQENMTPWINAGENGLNQLNYGLGLSGDMTGVNTSLGDSGYLQRDFEMSDFEADPGYQFRLSEGVKALDRSASAGGNLVSGSALKGITQYGQNLASQEYSNAYSRYSNEQAMKYNQLNNLQTTGLNAAGSLAGTASNYANSSSNILTGTAATIGGYNMNAAMANGNSAIQTANTINSGNIATANAIGGYGTNTATGYANADIASANANASAYTGVANSLSTGVNQLAQYYGGQSYSGYPSYSPNPAATTPYTWGTGYTGNYTL